MNLRKRKVYLLVLLAVFSSGVMITQAGGPNRVTGTGATTEGNPYRWAPNPISYVTDQGGLGNLNNSQANSLVLSAFQTWQSVGTTNISFQKTGSLSYDVSAGNIINFRDNLWNCSDNTQPVNSIVYDINGSAFAALGLDIYSTLGISEITCADDVNGLYLRSWVALNGWFILSGVVTSDYFKAVMVHEFGHLVGLDHSQINLDCYLTSCTAGERAGVPVMFPVLLDDAAATLATDDIAAISAMYPSSGFSSTTGRIQGRVMFADGLTPAQGYNVIARNVGDPQRTAVSCVSGFLFTAAAGNSLVPAGQDTESQYGSRDQVLIGYYDLPGLPVGDYTIEVEAINNSGEIPFIEGSGVGPIGFYLGFQYKLPGTCAPQYLNYPSSPGDSCSAKSIVTVGPGAIVNTNTDIILLGTQPRYDAWEDGP
jgi:hypothetical protein